ncbi:MAG: DNA translocase FtsK [Bacilli bacterium]|jgi:S-DNA-T family DNA segregation ATPase FtsK/SpoIIIE|nr:DNA translocase FtsK [Bacilli bacterium]MDD5182886.1 DNA translocase FtsK [Bacilli bacterium]
MKQNRKNFFIPKIKEDNIEEIKKEEDNKKNFVAPISGRKVKDKPYFPYVKYGNKGLQYEAFRDNKTENSEEIDKRFRESYSQKSQLIESENKNKESVNRIPDYLRKEDSSVKQSVKDDSLVSKNVIASKKENSDFVFLDKDFDEKELIDNSFNNDVSDVIEDQLVENKHVNRNLPASASEESAWNGRKIPKPQKTIKTSGKKYTAPPLDLLKKGRSYSGSDSAYVNNQREIIDNTLSEFHIAGHVTHFTKGPAVTQFEIKLDGGVKVEKIKNIASNLQMDLKCKSLRIEAPIPGKATVGIEVPNVKQDFVMLGELLANPEFLNDGNPLNVVLGLDISGNPVYLDISEMPHGLIAGTTGSGKSVSINCMIISMLYKADPDDVKLLLIDPKFIEFSNYEDIPHLASPVINDSKLAAAGLKWAVDEMHKRYMLFKATKRRNISAYNEFAKTDSKIEKMPYIIIIIDELADLMGAATNAVEEYIQRLAQKARAAGIHLIMATQRPSTDIIKGTIKANIQTRIAFAVNSQVDSMVILDHTGADKLLGKGDMLYSDGVTDMRLQGAFITDNEIISITNYLEEKYSPNYMFTQEDLQKRLDDEETNKIDPREDEFFDIIATFVVKNDAASINRIQKEFGIGFNRAQSIMIGLEELGIVSEGMGSRSRNVLVTAEELNDILGS